MSLKFYADRLIIDRYTAVISLGHLVLVYILYNLQLQMNCHTGYSYDDKSPVRGVIDVTNRASLRLG